MFERKIDFKQLKQDLRRSKKVDLEQLRTYKGFEDISDDEGQDVIDTLETLAYLLLTE